MTYAGSLRRCEVTVGDIDLVCTSNDAAAVVAHFAGWNRAQAVLAEGPTKASIWLEGGLQIDLRVLPDHLYGNLLQHFTGSREHNIRLREYAVRRNLRVSENGILNLETGNVITCTDEAGVYAALDMQYIPPELRNGLDEIELALNNALPEIVRSEDVRGDFHMHTTYSDGDDTLEAMIAAAAARGYQYHAITDHSQDVTDDSAWIPKPCFDSVKRFVRSVSATALRHCKAARSTFARRHARLRRRRARAARHRRRFGASAVRQTREEMTARLIRACENPYVTIIGHPTGRRFEGFPGYEYDYDAVFAAAARTGTAMEIDGQAARLDLPAALARKAKSFGVTFSLDSDSHRTGDLANVEFAVGQARRAGIVAGDVLNAKPLDEVRAFVARKRNAA